MPGAARVYHQLGVGKTMHEFPRAAGVIEVYMRDEYIRYISRIEILCLQHLYQAGNGRRGAGIDQCTFAAFDHQVNGGQARAKVIGINSADAELIVSDARQMTGRRKRFYPGSRLGLPIIFHDTVQRSR
jgi:hypothetical protein